MRCATLAETLRAEGVEVVFIGRVMPGDLCDWLETKGFEVRRLSAIAGPSSMTGRNEASSWLGVTLDQEIRETSDVLTSIGKLDWLVVDHYGIDTAWERALRSHCRQLMVIDDLADRDHDCDVLLDQNLVANIDARYVSHVPENCRCLLGPRFALLQKEYREWRARVGPRKGMVRRLLVFFGGVDAPNMTARALSALAKIGRNDLVVDVVVGAANPHHRMIADLCASLPGACLHENPPSLAPLMAVADLAIGAGGATTWERCCLVLPALIVTLAVNQEPIARELHARGLACYLGAAETLQQSELESALLTAIEGKDNEERSQRCMEVVDGMGASRVALALRAAPDMHVQLRYAEIKDEILLLEWANDPAVRRHAFISGRIEPQSHSVWFQNRLTDRDRCRIYIAEDDFGVPIGQVRFELGHGEWLISYSIDGMCRNRGLGRRLLDQALYCLVREVGPSSFVGRVKNDNPSSLRVFQRLGFTFVGLGNETIECRLSLTSPVPGFEHQASTPPASNPIAVDLHQGGKMNTTSVAP